MGKAYSILLRPLRTFNVENRAAKIISLKKPIPAPQYKYVEKQKKLADEVNPNFLKDHYRKDVQLDQRLKDVFITSTDSQGIKKVEESKSLPQNRFRPENIITSNYHEPIVIPVGKCSLTQAITFLKQHKQDPITHNIESIAVEYKMDKKIIGDILKHFNLFVMTPKYEIEEPEPDIGIEKIINDTLKIDRNK